MIGPRRLRRCIPNNVPAQSRDTKDADAAPAPKDGSPQPSSKALKPIVELQKAVNAKDVANIPAKLAAAQAVASTKDDRYIIAQLQLKARYAANDDAALASAIDAIAASGFVDSPATMAELYVALGSKLYNAKKFDAAATAFEQASTLNPSNSQALINLAESRFSTGRKADASALFQRAIQCARRAGQKPEEALYKRAVGDRLRGADAGRGRARRSSGSRLIRAPDSWRNALAIYQQLEQPDVEGALDMLRLMRATGALTNASDYQPLRERRGRPAELQRGPGGDRRGVAAKLIEPTSPLFKDIIRASRPSRRRPRPTSRGGEDRAERHGAAAHRRPLLRPWRICQGGRALPQALGKPGVDASLANCISAWRWRARRQGRRDRGVQRGRRRRCAEIAKYWLVYVQQQA